MLKYRTKVLHTYSTPTSFPPSSDVDNFGINRHSLKSSANNHWIGQIHRATGNVSSDAFRVNAMAAWRAVDWAVFRKSFCSLDFIMLFLIEMSVSVVCHRTAGLNTLTYLLTEGEDCSWVLSCMIQSARGGVTDIQTNDTNNTFIKWSVGLWRHRSFTAHVCWSLLHFRSEFTSVSIVT